MRFSHRALSLSAEALSRSTTAGAQRDAFTRCFHAMLSRIDFTQCIHAMLSRNAFAPFLAASVRLVKTDPLPSQARDRRIATAAHSKKVTK
jgi:hypothetical protein